MATTKRPQEPITTKMREEQERERIIALRIYSLDCCLAIEAFEALYKGLRDAYEALPALQKVTQPYVAEDYTVCDELPPSGEEPMQKIEVTVRGMAHDLPHFVLATKEMRADIYGLAMAFRREALSKFDIGFSATEHDWWLNEIRMDREWLAAREQGVTRG